MPHSRPKADDSTAFIAMLAARMPFVPLSAAVVAAATVVATEPNWN